MSRGLGVLRFRERACLQWRVVASLRVESLGLNVGSVSGGVHT